MMKIDAESDLGFRFEAGDVGGDEVAAAGTRFVSQRKQRGQNGGRRVAAESIVAVVEIERV